MENILKISHISFNTVWGSYKYWKHYRHGKQNLILPKKQQKKRCYGVTESSIEGVWNSRRLKHLQGIRKVHIGSPPPENTMAMYKAGNEFAFSGYKRFSTDWLPSKKTKYSRILPRVFKNNQTIHGEQSSLSSFSTTDFFDPSPILQYYSGK